MNIINILHLLIFKLSFTFSLGLARDRNREFEMNEYTATHTHTHTLGGYFYKSLIFVPFMYSYAPLRYPCALGELHRFKEPAFHAKINVCMGMKH